jgi:hypothetical protein
MCERLTSTLAKDHVFQCSEGVADKMPLIERACRVREWNDFVPEATGAISDQARQALIAGGALLGSFALYKGIQNLGREGLSNKVRGLAWVVAGIAAFTLPAATLGKA